jgi:hypothetical protein
MRIIRAHLTLGARALKFQALCALSQHLANFESTRDRPSVAPDTTALLPPIILDPGPRARHHLIPGLRACFHLVSNPERTVIPVLSSGPLLNHSFPDSSTTTHLRLLTPMPTRPTLALALNATAWLWPSMQYHKVPMPPPPLCSYIIY